MQKYVPHVLIKCEHVSCQELHQEGQLLTMGVWGLLPGVTVSGHIFHADA
jgi:hypothetical protein